MKRSLRATAALAPAIAAILGARTAGGAEGSAQARGDAPKNALHLELGGPGILYAVSYERFVLPRLGVRAGMSLFGLRENTTGDSLVAFSVPITALYLVGQGSHHLELGLGLLTGAWWSDLNSYQKTEVFGLLAATATLGYRYQPASGGWLFRVAFTPIYGGERFEPLGLPISPWGAIGAGYSF